METSRCNWNAPEPYECDQCQFVTHMKVTLHDHVRACHEEKETDFDLEQILENYHCRNCGFQTFSLLLLTKHDKGCEQGWKDVEKEGAEINSIRLIPEKSRLRYEAAYKAFMDWRNINKINSFTENDLLTYFGELSEKCKSSSLWVQYSMLRTTLNVNNNINIKNYTKLFLWLKRKGESYQPRKSKTFTPDEINTFLNEAPDKIYLATKVALIIGIMGGCRACELYSIQIEDVQDLGSTILVTVNNSRMKVRKFTITGHFYQKCKKYIDLRPTNPKCGSAFFLNYQKGKCTVQRIGKNKIGAMGIQIAKFLKLKNPEMYTGFSFRKLSSTIVVDTSGDITALERYSGWKSSTVAWGYIDNSMKNKIDTASKILQSNVHTQNTSATDANRNRTDNFSTEVLEVAEVTPTTLPERSKTKYETTYKAFMDWRSLNNFNTFSEKVLLAYFIELSEKYKSSSLWTLYSMLRATLNINNNINIENYLRLRSFLKRNGEGYQTKKSKSFTAADINTFLNEAPDNTYLATKVVTIMRVMGGCLRGELYSMNFEDVQDLGSAILVTVLNTDTKVFRQFTITGHFYHMCKKYIDIRPPDSKCTSFFLSYQNGKCSEQNIAKNKLGAMGKQIAEFLKLPNPEMYTGRSFPRSPDSLLENGSEGITPMDKHSGWEDATVAEGYDTMEDDTDTTNENTSINTQNVSVADADVNPTHSVNFSSDEEIPALKVHDGWRSTAVTEESVDDRIRNETDTENDIYDSIQNSMERVNEILQSLHKDISTSTQDVYAVDANIDSITSFNVSNGPANEISGTVLYGDRITLIPEKSRARYVAAYKAFMHWRRVKGVITFSENDLLTYFGELSEKCRSSSLWVHYSMLRATLEIYNNVNIKSYLKLRSWLKRKTKGYQARKAKIFTPDEINRFVNEAPDNIYLATKVASIMGIMGACRRSELYSMNIKDVQDLGSAMLVTVPNVDTRVFRQFAITDHFYHTCKKYVDLRPANRTCGTPFFLNYREGKCTTLRIGKNSFCNMGKQIAKFLKLPNPEMYTVFSFRRSKTLLKDGMIASKRKSTRTAVGYIDDAMENKINIANRILQAVHEDTSTLNGNIDSTPPIIFSNDVDESITLLKGHDGWRSTTETEGYIDGSIKNEVDTENEIYDSINHELDAESLQLHQDTSVCAQDTFVPDANINPTTINFSNGHAGEIYGWAPPNILEGDKTLIPEKSRPRYEAAYKSFMDWRSTNKVNSFSENDLLRYFADLSVKCSSSSLWVHYSMLRATLITNHNINIKTFTKLRSWLKHKAKGYQAKKSKMLSLEEINKFIIEAPDSIYLATKVASIMRVMGNCLKCELQSMNSDDLQDLGSAMLVSIRDSVTKAFRQFTLTGNCYQLCKKYADLRPSNANCTSFFLNYQKGKCTAQRIGKNKFGAMGKQIARFLKLPNPDMYTGVSFPRSSDALFLDNSGNIIRHGGRKSTTRSVGYIDDSIENKINTANTIFQSIHEDTSFRTQIPFTGYRNIDSTASVNFVNDSAGNVIPSEEQGGWGSTTITGEYIDNPIKNEIESENEIDNSIKSEIDTENEIDDLVKSEIDAGYEIFHTIHQNINLHKNTPALDSIASIDFSDGTYSQNDSVLKEPSVTLIPEKSRLRYEATYKAFMDWRYVNEVHSFSENDLLAYFGELSAKYKSSSLWTLYSMLRATLVIYNNINIENYTKLRLFLKGKAEGYRAKKYQIFTPEHINRFLIEAPDSVYLVTKVALIMGIMGACRRSELYSMNIEDVEDLGSTMLLTVPNPETKAVRKFFVTGHFYHICKKYIDLRPAHCGPPFFMNYRFGKCTVQRMGKNNFCAMGKQIARFLKLPNPETYTVFSFRGSSVLVEAGYAMKDRLEGHQNAIMHAQSTSVADVNINSTPAGWFHF